MELTEAEKWNLMCDAYGRYAYYRFLAYTADQQTIRDTAEECLALLRPVQLPAETRD